MTPEFLYKYRSVTSDDDLKFVLQTITKGEIFFGNSFSFNDVFDCRPAIIWDCSDDQFIYYAIKRIKRRRGGFRGMNEMAIVRGIKSRFGTSWDPRTAQGRIESQQQFASSAAKFGVFCATTRYNNLLMWSHYAASCTGICFELASAGGYWSKVTYSADRPKINLSIESDPTEMLDRSFLVKSLEWAYEEEWRIVGKRGVTPIPEGALRRVIFGVNCPARKREIIRRAIHDNNLRIGIAMAVQSADHFEFDIINMDIATPIQESD